MEARIRKLSVLVQHLFWIRLLLSKLQATKVTSNVSYGGGEITQQQLALMRVLSELSQGWWFWDEDQDTGVIFPHLNLQGNRLIIWAGSIAIAVDDRECAYD